MAVPFNAVSGAKLSSNIIVPDTSDVVEFSAPVSGYVTEAELKKFIRAGAKKAGVKLTGTLVIYGVERRGKVYDVDWATEVDYGCKSRKKTTKAVKARTNSLYEIPWDEFQGAVFTKLDKRAHKSGDSPQLPRLVLLNMYDDLYEILKYVPADARASLMTVINAGYPTPGAHGDRWLIHPQTQKVLTSR